MEATNPTSPHHWQAALDLLGSVTAPTRLRAESDAALCIGGFPTGNPTTWFVRRSFAIEVIAQQLFAYGHLSHRLAFRLSHAMRVIDELVLPSRPPEADEDFARWSLSSWQTIRERERAEAEKTLRLIDLEEEVKTLKQERHSLNLELSRAKSFEAQIARLTKEVVHLTEVNHGGVQFEVKTADGHTVERGDRVYFGSRPKEHAFVIDPDHAIDPASGRIVGLSDGDPIFAKRDNARAWRRAQRNPHPTSSAVTGTAAAGTTQSAGGTAAAPAAAGTVFELLSPSAIDGGLR